MCSLTLSPSSLSSCLLLFMFFKYLLKSNSHEPSHEYTNMASGVLTADALITTGLAKLGYDYVNIGNELHFPDLFSSTGCLLSCLFFLSIML